MHSDVRLGCHADILVKVADEMADVARRDIVTGEKVPPCRSKRLTWPSFSHVLPSSFGL